MIRLAIRPLLMVMLAAYFVAGLSHFVVASNTMAIEMARPAATNMAAMGCEDQTPEKPCEHGLLHCPTGCLVPSAALPASGTLALRVPEPGTRLADEPRLATGLAQPPGLPPPRTIDIG